MSRVLGLLAGIAAVMLVLGLASAPLESVGTASDGASPQPTEPQPSSAPSFPLDPLTLAAPRPSPDPSRPPEPPVLRPNVRSLTAQDLRIQRTENGRRLRFSAWLANTGPGPLLVRPRRRPGACPPGQLEAVQRIHVDRNGNGSFEQKRDTLRTHHSSGCMLDHRGHDHWHFDAMARYSLRRPDAAQALVSREKVSYCLRDNVRVPGQPVLVRREHFGDCERGGPQGISPGWVDIYKFDLDGQWLAVPRRVRNEVLCLDLEADPLHLLEEADEDDNATSLGIRINGADVRRAAPRHCR